MHIFFLSGAMTRRARYFPHELNKYRLDLMDEAGQKTPAALPIRTSSEPHAARAHL